MRNELRPAESSTSLIENVSSRSYLSSSSQNGCVFEEVAVRLRWSGENKEEVAEDGGRSLLTARANNGLLSHNVDEIDKGLW